MKLLESAAKFCAILAGLILTLITISTCINIIGRETIGRTAPGDFELVGVAAGAAIALFMPWCQFQRGNIIVDFFTSKCSSTTNAKLDRFGTLLMAFIFAVLAWRTTLGGMNAWTTNSSSMMMGFPEWIVYVFMVPPFALTAIIALAQTFGSAPATEATAEGATA